MNKTQKQIESVISERVGKLLKQEIGEGTENVITRIVVDTILIRIKGALSPAEKKHGSRSG